MKTVVKKSGYKVLKQKQKDGLLTENETYILDKYFMSKKFKIDINKIATILLKNTLEKNIS